MDFLKGRYALAVAIGAIFGALSRFYITELAKAVFGKDFGFYGTFFINVSGCLLIAYILTLATENLRIISPEFRLMTTTGFCGAYTTFSTYGLESVILIDAKRIIPALTYGLGSAVVGIISVKLGMELVRWLK